MKIEKNFFGGNIEVLSQNGDDVFVEREIRNDNGYFYWAFCVKGAMGKKVRFIFPQDTRVGRFGAAVSLDLKNWFWSNTKETVNGADAFTYTFSVDENCVYFAHNMIYSKEMLKDFAKNNNLEIKTFTQTKKGRDVPCFKIGSGEKLIVVTSRHHACESTGTYVLQGFAQGCLEKIPSGVEFLFVPFVDFDGVTDGDAGKGRLPHDHNRDYGETIIYNETRKLRELADSGNVIMNFDFHSPHHDGGLNDYPYIMKFAKDGNEIYDAMSKTFRTLTQNDENSMTYTGEYDIEYGGRWNETTLLHNRNYFLPRTKMNVSITMETPYFGVCDNMFTREKAINMGKHLYNAVYETIFKEEN